MVGEARREGDCFLNTMEMGLDCCNGDEVIDWFIESTQKVAKGRSGIFCGSASKYVICVYEYWCCVGRITSECD